MALLTDGNPNDTIALKVYESAILDVANIERIDLDVKLTLATEEVSEDVIDILLDHTQTQDPQSIVRRMIGVSDVVVTTQLKRWHALHTLEIVYRDAFNNQLNDRYEAKFLEYQDLAINAREHTVRFRNRAGDESDCEGSTAATERGRGRVTGRNFLCRSDVAECSGSRGRAERRDCVGAGSATEPDGSAGESAAEWRRLSTYI